MISKLIFLIKCKSPIKVILIFLYQKIRNILDKKNILIEKRKNQNFIKNYKITHDWFSPNCYYFNKYLKNLSTEFYYLEIGSYEGNSAIFIATNYPNSSITCVDPWEPYEEKEKENFSSIESRFDFNTKEFKIIKKYKKTSDSFFLSNKKLFDFIYIDGFHKYDYVLRDCLNAWNSLKIGGILACDDYIGQAWNDIKLNPCYAINKFIKDKKNEINILTVTKSQIFFKKLGHDKIV